MNRRKKITWTSAVLAVVAIAFVAARFGGWRCERFLPGIWAVSDDFGNSVGYFVFRPSGSYTGVSDRTTLSDRHWTASHLGTGNYVIEGCRVRFAATHPEEAVLRFRGRDHFSMVGGETSATFHRVTDPPAWVEELFESVGEREALRPSPSSPPRDPLRPPP